MNITIIQGAFLPVPPVAGGAVEKLWFDLGREFARRGLGVTHVSRLWPGLPSRAEVDGVAYRRIAGFDRPRSRPLAMLMDLVYSIRCLAAVRRSDVIVTNTFFLPLLMPLLARKGIVYVSVHRYPQGQMRWYRRVDRLQCVSTAVADAVREQAPAMGKRVKVVPNYVSTELTDAKIEATWASRRREVLFVGRVHPEKGVDLLIRAFASIPMAQRRDWTLRIVGPHDVAAGGGGAAFLAELKSMAIALDVPIEWSGPVYDHDALNDAYREASVFVYPSVAAKGEAFPLAPLEAMGQGCPVITSDLSCFDDFIVAGSNADCFALGSDDVPAQLGTVLQALMLDEGRRRSYATAGLRTVEDFTLSRVADTFVADFRSLQKS